MLVMKPQTLIKKVHSPNNKFASVCKFCFKIASAKVTAFLNSIGHTVLLKPRSA